MDKKEIRKILQKYYKPETVRKLIEGRCFPSLKKAIQLQDDGITVHFWKDIKSFTNESITSTIKNKQLLTKKETEWKIMYLIGKQKTLDF